MPRAALASVAAALNVVLASVMTGLVFAGDEEMPRAAADWVADLALAALWVLPAAVALVGRSQPPLLVAAAVLAIVAAWTTWSVSLLLIVCALLYGLAAAGTRGRVSRPAVLVAVTVVALGVAARAAVFADAETVCWEYVVGRDGTTRAWTVAASDAGSTPVLGDDLVEAGGGCRDRASVWAGAAALSLAALAVAAGTRVSGRA